MNRVMLAEWHRAITRQSTVLFLGDLSFGSRSRPPRYWHSYLRKLARRFIYVKGSHDLGIRSGVTPDCYDAVIAHLDGLKLYLVHDPGHAAPGYDWIIHGHTHNTRPLIDTASRMINVSVEATGYRPMRLSEILQRAQVP